MKSLKHVYFGKVPDKENKMKDKVLYLSLWYAIYNPWSSAHFQKPELQ